jgi:hypothetical protein
LESNIINRGLPVRGGETVPPCENLHGHPSRAELAEQGTNGYPHQAQIESSAFSDEDEVTLGGSNPSSVRFLRNPDKAKAHPKRKGAREIAISREENEDDVVDDFDSASELSMSGRHLNVCMRQS